MRLLLVEIRRLMARRFFRYGVAAVLAGLVAMIAVSARDSRRPSEAELARATAAAESAAAPALAERQACYQSRGEVSGGPKRLPECEAQFIPRTEDFLEHRPYVFADETRTIGTISTAITVLFAFFVGATAVGAEWRHGTLGALLLWEPRRMRVFAAKLGAMLGLTALVSTIGFATALGSGWLVSRVVGLTGTVGRAGVHAVVLQDLRGLALGAAAAACGFAVALTARRTAAALGVLMAYLAVGEIGVRGMSDESQGWLLSSRILAWTSENFTYYVDRCTIGDGCSRGAHLLGLSDGGSYLAVLTVVLLAVAAAIFRRREVT